MHVSWFIDVLDGWGVAIDIPKCWLYKAKMAFLRWVRALVLMMALLLPVVAWAMTKAECTSSYNSCTTGCRSLPDPKLRAACWPACMTVYAACLAIAE